jgi:uncharacterized caspase-like protein
MLRVVLAVFLVFLPAAAAVSQDAGKTQRIALVIGNSAYEGSAALAAPAKDAELVAAALMKSGFAVNLITDGDREALEKGLGEFYHALSAAQAAFVYYAGHATHAAGSHRVIPIGAAPGNDDLSTAAIAAEMTKHGNGLVKIIVVDAGFTNAPKGNAQLADPRVPFTNGTLYFARKPGQVAPPATKAPSVFARELSGQLQGSKKELGMMFLDTTRAVSAATSGGQLPWLESEATDFFYINGE